MASLRAGMKRKSKEDLQRAGSKSPRLSDPGSRRGRVVRRNSSSDTTSIGAGQDYSGTSGPSKETQAAKSKDDGSVEPSNSNFDEDEYWNKRAKEHENAKIFLRSLVLLIETRRMETEQNEGAGLTQKQKLHLETACNMVAEADLMMNLELNGKIKLITLTDLLDISAALKRTQVKEEEYLMSLSDVDAAVVARTAAIFSDSEAENSTPEEVAALKSQTIDFQKEVERAQERSRRIYRELCLERNGDESRCRYQLVVIENALVRLALIEPPTSLAGKESLDRTQPDDQSQETSLPEDDHANLRQPSGGHAPSRPTEPDIPPRNVPDIIKQEKLDALQKAEGELHDIQNQRERARRYYDQELWNYLAANQRGDIKGTKTDFDLRFFMDQVDFTAEQKHAEERVERSKEAAQVVGAVHFEEETSNYADLSHGGYADPGEGGEDLLWEEKRKEIKAWVDIECDRVFDDNGRPTAIGEDSWSIMDPWEEPGGKPINAFQDGIQPYLDGLIEEPEWRKKIDSWAEKQNRIRATIQLRELNWWEECCGVY